jgi:hypothetical protein
MEGKQKECKRGIIKWWIKGKKKENEGKEEEWKQWGKIERNTEGKEGRKTKYLKNQRKRKNKVEMKETENDFKNETGNKEDGEEIKNER